MEFSAGIEMQANIELEADVNVDLAVDDYESVAYDQESEEQDVEIEVVIDGDSEQRHITPLEQSILQQPQLEIIVETPDIVLDTGTRTGYETENKTGYQTGAFNNENVCTTGTRTGYETEARKGYQTGAFNHDNILDTTNKVSNRVIYKPTLIDQMAGMIVEVDLVDELKPDEEADCTFCCRQTGKSCTNCYNHVLVWIIITAIFVTSLVQILKGIILLMVSSGHITLSQIKTINASNLMPVVWVTVVFYISIPILSIAGCIFWTIFLIKKKAKEGYGTGLNAVFAVPDNYQFTDVEKVDPSLNPEVLGPNQSTFQ